MDIDKKRDISYKIWNAMDEFIFQGGIKDEEGVQRVFELLFILMTYFQSKLDIHPDNMDFALNHCKSLYRDEEFRAPEELH